MKVLPKLRDADFFLPQNQKIYRAMEVLIGSGKPIDMTTLSETLRKFGESEEAIAYLSKLADGLPRVTNVEHYAEIVVEKARLRRVIVACSEVERSAQDAGAESGTVVESAIEKLLALASGESGNVRVVEWNDASASAVRQIERAKEDPASVCRLRFGLSKLDEITSGLRKKELTLIVGETSHGKSLLAEQLAVTSNDLGYLGLIFSAEMSAETIAMRQVAYEADVYFYHTRRPETITEEALEKIRFAAKRERNLAIVDSGITPARIWALSEARKRSSGLDFVVVDYDQLVIEAGLDPNADPGEFFRHQARFVTQSIKFANRLDIAFILLAQQRKRPSGGKPGAKPQLDDIFGSSALRNHPHTIMWIVREFFTSGMKKEKERDAVVYVMKARNDKTGSVKLDFDPKFVHLFDKKPGKEEAFED